MVGGYSDKWVTQGYCRLLSYKVMPDPLRKIGHRVSKFIQGQQEDSVRHHTSTHGLHQYGSFYLF